MVGFVFGQGHERFADGFVVDLHGHIHVQTKRVFFFLHRIGNHVSQLLFDLGSDLLRRVVGQQRQLIPRRQVPGTQRDAFAVFPGGIILPGQSVRRACV